MTRAGQKGDSRESGCRGYTDNEGLEGGRAATIKRAGAEAIRITKDQRRMKGDNRES